MKSNLVRIGNSRGIRIPRPIIDQCGFGKEVELRIESGALMISPARRPRQGWDEAFAAMASHGDDRLLDAGAGGSRWDETEWRW